MASTPASDLPQRIQVLATEQSTLVASRTSTQTEVLTRISMFLTFVSAVLVSLALVGQATGFGETFPLVGVAVLSIAVAVGLLTQVRVMNVAMEDLMYVIALNRLRGEYAKLLPGVEAAFMSGITPDREGVNQTYYFLTPKRGPSQILGSSMMFIIVVNSALGGLLVGAVVVLAGGGPVFAAIAGAVVGLGWFVLSLGRGFRRFRAVWAG
jgi:membrane-associated HD superfamily phosphohydrolase